MACNCGASKVVRKTSPRQLPKKTVVTKNGSNGIKKIIRRPAR